VKILAILLIFLNFNLLANDLFFDEVVASDMSSGELSDATDALIAPFILLGKKSGEISVNVRMDMSIASIDKKEFLAKTQQYLKKETYTKLTNIAGDFILFDKLPDGINIKIDEELNIIASLTPEVMKNIDPKILNNLPKLRKPLKTPVKSIINDVSLRLNYETALIANVGVQTSIRHNRFLFTGNSNYSNHKLNIFNENALLNYEDNDKNYLAGYFSPPNFAGVGGEKTLGFSIGNTKLNNYIILESDRKYLELTYPSSVKIYIGDILYSEKEFSAGKHALDIPLNIEPSLIKVQIEDDYGRSKDIVFDFAGNFSNHIPKQGQYLYFASIGNNLNNQPTSYLGVEFGINKLSKLSVATNISKNYQTLGINYYKLFENFTFDNNLTFSNNSGIKFINKIFIKKFKTNLRTNWQKDFVETGIKQNDKAEILANRKFVVNDKLEIKVNASLDVINKNNGYGLLANYRFSKNLTTSFSYESDGEARFSLDWILGKDTELKSSFDSENQAIAINHSINDKRSIEAQYYNKNTAFVLNDESNIFNNRIKLHKNTNNTKVQLRTNFAIVSSGGEVNLSKTIGNGGFITFKAGDGLDEKIVASIGDNNCEISKASTCVIKTPSNRDIMPVYELADVGFDKVLTGIDNPIYIPSRGGIKHTINAHKMYFVQAKMTSNNKPIKLLVGKIIDKNGVENDVFTDEEGLVFMQLQVGKYLLKFAGFAEKSITIEGGEELNLGNIELIKKSVN
jgi:hypothetical protein